MAADDGCLLNEETCLVASDECRQGIRGHGGRAKKENQQARYWSYLFDNLHRVVDEIFCTCEADRSIIECQEMMSTLDVCRKDFEKLIKKIEVEDSFEGDPHNRPQSVSWEIQHSSLRSRSSSQLSDMDQLMLTSSHVRQLEFSHSPSGRKSPEDETRNTSVVKTSEESMRDAFEREPTPVSALFSGTGFELASKVVQTRETSVGSSLERSPPKSELAPVDQSSRSIPVVHKSHGGKLQVYVDIPDNAPLNYYQREPTRVPPDSEMMGIIEAENPPEEGWEVVYSRYRRTVDRRNHSEGEEDGNEDCDVEDSDEVVSVSSSTSDRQSSYIHRNSHLNSPDVSHHSQSYVEDIKSPSFLSMKVREDEGHSRPHGRLASSDGALELFHPSRTGEKRFSMLSEDLDKSVLLSPELRSPAKLAHLHQKLSSPQRRKLLDSEESRKLLENRLTKAQQQRSKIHEERAQRLRSVSQKVCTVEPL
jgi:hypothetical protein